MEAGNEAVVMGISGISFAAGKLTENFLKLDESCILVRHI